MMAKFKPDGGFQWEESMNKIPIGSLRDPERLLARMVL
jgi:hypothetical protein